MAAALHSYLGRNRLLPDSRPFSLSKLIKISLVVALATLNSNFVRPVDALLSCQSPTGSHSVGDITALQWIDDGAWPTAQDVYSTTADVLCSSNSQKLLELASVTNGQTWIIPSNILTATCPGSQVHVEYSGKLWDALHLLHVQDYMVKCEDMTIQAPALPPATTAMPVTATITVSTGISTSLTTIATIPAQATVSSSSQQPPLTMPTTPSDQTGSHTTNTTTTTTKTNVPAAALGTLAAVAVVAVIIFGLIMNHRRKRLAQEQRWLKQENLRYGGIGSSADMGWLPETSQLGRDNRFSLWSSLEYPYDSMVAIASAGTMTGAEARSGTGAGVGVGTGAGAMTLTSISPMAYKYNPLISLPSLELDLLQPGQMMPEYDVGDGHRDYYNDNGNSNGKSNNFGESTFIRNPSNGTGATVTAAGATADASTVRRRPTLPDIQVPPEPERSYIGNHMLWPHGDIPTAARDGVSDSGGGYGHGYDRHGWHDGYGRYYDVHVDG